MSGVRPALGTGLIDKPIIQHTHHPPMLRTSVTGITFPNPVILASGIRDETGHSMVRMAQFGAGGVVTKSVGPVPRPGNDLPALVEVEGGMLNSMGLPNPGVDHYGEEVEVAKGAGVPIIGSVFGPDTDGFVAVAEKMASYGVDAIELNLSCPNAQGTAISFGQDPDAVKQVTSAVKAKVDIPVWVKLTPMVVNIVDIGKAAVEAGADAIVATNTLMGMTIDVWSQKPVLANTTGGLSGPALKPVALRCVWQLASSPDITVPIIGVGGITDWKDAVEFFLAGASLVSVGTAVYYEGPEVFGKINEGLQDYLDRKGCESIDQIIGKGMVE